MRGECPRVDRIEDVSHYLVLALLLLFVPASVSAQTTATVSGTVKDAERRRHARRHSHRDQRRDQARARDRHRRRRPIRRSPACRQASTSCAPRFRDSSRTCDAGSRWRWPTTVVVNIVLEVGGTEARRRRRSHARRQHHELRAELPGRRGHDRARCRSTAATTPTSRCCSPACSPTRTVTADRSSPTASGMSVNGQDPRANVYLLDGTLQNDFTNGPAGSAAGTALGMETVREFRVETNAYSAEFGRHCRRAGQRPDQVRQPTASAAAPTSTTATTRSTRATTSTRSASPTSRATSSAAPSAARWSRIGCSSSAATRRSSSGWARRSRRSCPTTTRGSASFRAATVGVNPAVAPYLAEYPARQRAVARPGARGLRLPVRSAPRRATSPRAVSTTTPAPRQFFARYTFDDTKQFLPTDYPQFPRQFLSRNQFFTGEYREVLSGATFNTARLSFSRTRIGQNVEANTSQPLAPFVPGRAIMGDIDIGGLKRFGPQSSANLRLVQNVFSFQDDLVHSRGTSPHQGRRARRALPGQHGQPDLQPGHLRLPQPERVPAQRAEQLRRPHAGGAVRPLLALHAVRLLRPGRVPRHAAADASTRDCATSSRRCPRISTAAIRRCRT